MKIKKEEKIVGKTIKIVSRSMDVGTRDNFYIEYGEPRESIVLITQVDGDEYGNYEIYSGNCRIPVSEFLTSTNESHAYLTERTTYELKGSKWVKFDILDYVTDVRLKELNIQPKYKKKLKGRMFAYKTSDDWEKHFKEKEMNEQT